MPEADQRFVEVYRAANLVEAYVVRNELIDAGIPVEMANTNLELAVGDIPAGWATAPRLLVAESQLNQAVEIIRKIKPPSDSKLGLSVSETLGIVPMAPLAGVLAVAEYLVPERKPGHVEPTCCLACGHEMSDSETRCSQCGWTYETESAAILTES